MERMEGFAWAGCVWAGCGSMERIQEKKCASCCAHGVCSQECGCHADVHRILAQPSDPCVATEYICHGRELQVTQTTQTSTQTFAFCSVLPV